jgi:tetratricopeptide (TPR) repeat protein
MQPDRRCLRCGQIIPWGCEGCPYCSSRRGYFWTVRRDGFLTIVFILLIFLFIVTGIAVGRYHAMEKRLALDWSGRGLAALKAGQGHAALIDFRNALAYSRDNPMYQLWLAESLAATGRIPEARTYLVSLRERDPGNGPVNLELARLAAQEHNVEQAVEYYHDAVYCEWEGDPVVERRSVRLELVNFLLVSDQKEAARAELIAIEGNLPPTPKLQIQVGKILMTANGYDDALRLFRQALNESPRSAEALAGAGECYFRTGRYAEAEYYLNRSLRQDAKMTQVADMRDTARAVLDLDPFARRLSEEQRTQRAQHDLDQALSRLHDCAGLRGVDLENPGDDPLQKLYAQAATFQATQPHHILTSGAESVVGAMDLVFEIEKGASQACGEAPGADVALLLIAKEQEGARQ